MNRGRRSLRVHPDLAVFALYLMIAVALEWPAIVHLDGVCACTQSADPTQYMWAFVWWPHAVFNGLNPFVTNAIWSSSGGFNLASATATPAEAILAYPLTALLGPLASFNVLTTLAPALGAWFTYRLCFYLTGSRAASIVGGYVFGFSSYELAQLLGHLHLDVTFAIPAAVLLTLQRIDEAITRRRYVVLTSAVLIFQLLTSSEVLLTLTIMGMVTFACAFALLEPRHRERIKCVLPELGFAYAVMVVVCSPFLYYALTGPAVTGGPLAADSLNLFIPTWITALGGDRFGSVSSSFAGHDISEAGSYLGLPLLAIVAAYTIGAWRKATTKALLAVLAVATVWSLGSHLHIDGHRTVLLPWEPLGRLPLLRQVIPARISLYTSLVVAVIVALWLSRPAPHRWRRWSLAGLAVLFLFPSLAETYPHTNVALFHARYETPRFFTTTLYRSYLKRDVTVLPIPYASLSYSLLWQARTGMYFRLASGSFGYVPPSYPPLIVSELVGGTPLSSGSAERLRSLIVTHRISAVIVEPAFAARWGPLLASLGLQRTAADGVLVYRLAHPAFTPASETALRAGTQRRR